MALNNKVLIDLNLYEDGIGRKKTQGAYVLILFDLRAALAMPTTSLAEHFQSVSLNDALFLSCEH